MLLKENEKKKVLITIAVVLFGVLFFTILNFKKPGERDLPTTKDKTVIPQSLNDNKKIS